ncbi:MAG: hypothetical protein EZS28_022374 [Streblomastix strix]|uniref:Uncharacterized protein n=1 Tax=Streblomastix strix TaxID=222440 RepID=A0A5J4VHW7_9EUKA|nr:MAG: hypothetical protein EZS28_022374 [Streblomastix strix]
MSNNEEKNKALIEKKNQEEEDDEGEWEEYSESSSESNSSDDKKKPIFIQIAPQLNKLPVEFIKRFEIQRELDELINKVSTPYQKSNDEAILLLISNKWRQQQIDNFYSSNYEECLKAAGFVDEDQIKQINGQEEEQNCPVCFDSYEEGKATQLPSTTALHATSAVNFSVVQLQQASHVWKGAVLEGFTRR